MARLGELDGGDRDVPTPPNRMSTGLERARLLNHLGVTLYWKGNLADAASTLATRLR